MFENAAVIYYIRYITQRFERIRFSCCKVCYGIGFTVDLKDGRRLRARKLIIATGVADTLPNIPGFAPLYGKSIHHCPYCDGWQWRGRRLAAYGRGEDAAGLALLLLGWSRRVVVLGVRSAGIVEIVSGVQAGETVVVGGLERMGEGAPVAPRPRGQPTPPATPPDSAAKGPPAKG